MRNASQLKMFICPEQVKSLVMSQKGAIRSGLLGLGSRSISGTVAVNLGKCYVTCAIKKGTLLLPCSEGNGKSFDDPDRDWTIPDGVPPLFDEKANHYNMFL